MLKLINFKLYPLDIYPLDIYLHIGEDIEETLTNFIDSKTKLQCHGNWGESIACVYYDILNKENNSFSIIIAFEEVPLFPIIVHELVHATNRIYEHIGQPYTGDENHAYLSELLATEIETFINEYKLTQDETTI